MSAAKKITSSLGKRGITKPFSSPGGKEAWRGIVLSRMPEHDVYVEPYAGSATIFFAKTERASIEVLADVNPDVVATYTFLRDGTDEDFEWMRKQNFDSDPDRFEALKRYKPKDRREKAYRYKYLNLFSVRGNGARYNKSDNAKKSNASRFLSNLEKFRERLEGVKIFQADALDIIKRFDSEKTFFYLDPPWKPEGSGEEWKSFDGDAFAEAVRAVKGKALVSYQGKINLGTSWKSVTIASALGGVGPSSEQQILINFDPPVSKRAMYMEGEGGTHSHAIFRNELTTGLTRWDAASQSNVEIPGEPDGPHAHLFVVGGVLVSTEFDGSHVHTLPDSAADTTNQDGQHSHTVATANGPLETGAEVSAHAHSLGVDRTVFDGMHIHTLEVNGEVTTSLTPGQFWSLFASEQSLQVSRSEGDQPSLTKSALEVPVQKPFPNEHRARQADPDQFERFRRGRPEGFPSTIDVIWGIASDGTTHIQSIAFDSSAWTAEEAKTWLKEHNFSSSQFEEASPTEKLYPASRDPADAKVHLHFEKDGHALAFRFKFDDRAIGWTVATQRAPLLNEPAKLFAKSWTPLGNRFSRAILDSPVPAAKGALSAGTAVRVDTAKVEYGLQDAHDREYFLSKGGLVSGILRLKADTDNSGREGWTCSLSKTSIPRVLTNEAVQAGVMPPDGFSSLPLSIEKLIPPQYRYWKAAGEEAREIRDALVETGAIDDVSVVDGEIRACITKRYVVPYPQYPTEVLPFAKATSPIARVAKMVPRVGKSPLLISPAVANDIGTDDLVEKISRESTRDYLIAWPDSPHARQELSKLGRPFLLKRGGSGLIFVSSQPLNSFDDVNLLPDGKLDFGISDDPFVGLPARIAKMYRAALERDLDIVQIGKRGNQEERFVLGEVLIPEKVDAQGDIYSAEEIRKAAHGFMEFHGNRGDMHKELVNDRVVVLESFLAPVTFSTKDAKGRTRKVLEGTWLLGYGIRDDGLWKLVKTGQRNGFSIGGTAVRRPRTD